VARSLEYWAVARGSQPALFEGQTTLTYRDWNEYADMLADAFAGRGLGRDDVIAVRCRNRIEWAVIALACAKIDAQLVTLDPDLPVGALRQRLIASHAVAIIVGDTAPVRLAPALEGLPMRLRTTMDGAYPGFFNFWDLFPPVAQPRFGRVQPSLLAWASSQGERAVALPRRRAAPASISKPPIPDNGVSLITVPMHRVWGCVQFWKALTAGRAIAFMRTFDAAAALEVVRERHVTHWWALPETFVELHELGDDVVRNAGCTTLRDVVIGGAAASSTIKAWLVDMFGSIVSEAYGSTVTGLISVIPSASLLAQRGSCGRPIRGAAVEVRDTDGRRLPPGAVGEIWARTQRTLECEICGPAVTRRDANGFVATGDAGCVDGEGFIYLTGRSSGQESQQAG
jgi:long-chain acyl-CoA synthetase